MQVLKLSEQEKAELGYNWKVIIVPADLTETTVNTAQTIELISAGIGAIVRDAAYYLKTAFEDASDAAFNVTTITVGDGSSVARFLASKEINENGTEIDAHISANDINTLPYAYLAADTIDIVFTGESGKALNDIDTGELWVFLDCVELSAH